MVLSEVMGDLLVHGMVVSHLRSYYSSLQDLDMEPSILTGITACFKLSTGDVEDAPALDPIAKFDLVEKNGAVYVKGEESLIKAGRTEPNVSCSKSGQEHVVIIGGYVSTSTHSIPRDRPSYVHIH